MAYSREIGRDFWFDFDNQTLFQRTPEISDALSRAYFRHGFSLDTPMNALRVSFGGSDHPTVFREAIVAGKNGFIDLAKLQLEIMDAHLSDDESIQNAFEDFGQGVLFDDRPTRPLGRRIHMMDGTPDTWVGYHRWHAFSRAAVLFGADARWLHVNRCIALAWAIQSEANPTVDDPANPELEDSRIRELRESWMNLPAEKLDWAFVNHSSRAPHSNLLPGWSPDMGRYAKVQELLRAAATNGTPLHADGSGREHGRFWALPYTDFMALPPIYGHPLIAEPGPERGARSNLVKVLKGSLSGIPQMPLNNPPMQEADIQFIQDWIDDGCPEDA